MAVLVRERGTGRTVEVFNIARDDVVFAGPPGRPAEGKLYQRHELEPDPVVEVLRQGLVPWYDRAEA